jgi:hypothetical protein
LPSLRSVLIRIVVFVFIILGIGGLLGLPGLLANTVNTWPNKIAIPR